MPNIDLSILNQRQTPAFYADTLANRPAAGFVGRIFVSTDTFAFYRDNGTTWDLIGGPGTGTVTGTGAAGQVTYWNGASTITGTNNLFYDTVNSRLGVNTNAPGTALDVHNATNTVLQLNQTTATNDTRISFQNNGSSLWRIGNLYNAGANDFEIFDVVGALQSLTVKKTTGQVLIGTSTVGSGKLVVRSASSDNGIQIVGATAPSLRIDSAETGPTKRIGLAIATNTNNFIQGSADRDMCIFNGSTTASPMLFGIYDAGAVSVQEASRISASRNFLIGTTTDAGYKLDVNGTSRFTGLIYANSNIVVGAASNTNQINIYEITSPTIKFQNSGADRGKISANSNSLIYNSLTSNGHEFQIDGVSKFSLAAISGNVLIGNSSLNTASNLLTIATTSANEGIILLTQANGATNSRWGIVNPGVNNTAYIGTMVNNAFAFYSASTEKMRLETTGNLLIGTTTDNGYKLNVNGNIFSNGDILISKSTPFVNIRGTSFGNSGAGLTLEGWATTYKNWQLSVGTSFTPGLELYSSTVAGGNTFTTAVGRFDETTGVYTALSDINKKKNLSASYIGLDAVLKLKPTLYNIKSQSNDEPKELGFIAQEVKETIKEAYVESGDFIGLNYQAITAALVKAVQELNDKIENLK